MGPPRRAQPASTGGVIRDRTRGGKPSEVERWVRDRPPTHQLLLHDLRDRLGEELVERRRIFQHRNLDKWKLSLRNRRIADFRFEKECRDELILLRKLWDGRIRIYNLP